MNMTSYEYHIVFYFSIHKSRTRINLFNNGVGSSVTRQMLKLFGDLIRWPLQLIWNSAMAFDIHFNPKRMLSVLPRCRESMLLHFGTVNG